METIRTATRVRSVNAFDQLSSGKIPQLIEADALDTEGNNITESDIKNRMIAAVFNARNATLLAYGATGSGKTRFTSEFFAEFTKDLFASLNPADSLVDFSYFEIVDESVRDLLRPSLGTPSFGKMHTSPLGISTDGAPLKPLVIRRYARTGALVIPGLTRFPVLNDKDVMYALDCGRKSNVLQHTNWSNRSSRCHTCLLLEVKISETSETAQAIVDRVRGDQKIEADVMYWSRSQILIVDLAGSEKIYPSVVIGEQSINSTSIAPYLNESIAQLNFCVQTLSGHHRGGNRKNSVANNNATPSSMMKRLGESALVTQLLHEPLTGNSETFVVGTISPLAKHMRDTSNTLIFLSHVRQIKTKFVPNLTHQNRGVVAEASTEILRLNKFVARKHLANNKTEAQQDGGALEWVKSEIEFLETLLQHEIESFQDRVVKMKELNDKFEKMHANCSNFLLDFEATERLKWEKSVSQQRRTSHSQQHNPMLRQQTPVSKISTESWFESPPSQGGCPQLINVNFDPSLTGCLNFSLPTGHPIGIGRKGKIAIHGLGIDNPGLANEDMATLHVERKGASFHCTIVRHAYTANYSHGRNRMDAVSKSHSHGVKDYHHLRKQVAGQVEVEKLIERAHRKGILKKQDHVRAGSQKRGRGAHKRGHSAKKHKKGKHTTEAGHTLSSELTIAPLPMAAEDAELNGTLYHQNASKLNLGLGMPDSGIISSQSSSTRLDHHTDLARHIDFKHNFGGLRNLGQLLDPIEEGVNELNASINDNAGGNQLDTFGNRLDPLGIFSNPSPFAAIKMPKHVHTTSVHNRVCVNGHVAPVGVPVKLENGARIVLGFSQVFILRIPHAEDQKLWVDEKLFPMESFLAEIHYDVDDKSPLYLKYALKMPKTLGIHESTKKLRRRKRVAKGGRKGKRADRKLKRTNKGKAGPTKDRAGKRERRLAIRKGGMKKRLHKQGKEGRGKREAVARLLTVPEAEPDIGVLDGTARELTSHLVPLMEEAQLLLGELHMFPFEIHHRPGYEQHLPSFHITLEAIKPHHKKHQTSTGKVARSLDFFVTIYYTPGRRGDQHVVEHEQHGDQLSNVVDKEMSQEIREKMQNRNDDDSPDAYLYQSKNLYGDPTILFTPFQFYECLTALRSLFDGRECVIQELMNATSNVGPRYVPIPTAATSVVPTTSKLRIQSQYSGVTPEDNAFVLRSLFRLLGSPCSADYFCFKNHSLQELLNSHMPKLMEDAEFDDGAPLSDGRTKSLSKGRSVLFGGEEVRAQASEDFFEMGEFLNGGSQTPSGKEANLRKTVAKVHQIMREASTIYEGTLAGGADRGSLGVRGVNPLFQADSSQSPGQIPGLLNANGLQTIAERGSRAIEAINAELPDVPVGTLAEVGIAGGYGVRGVATGGDRYSSVKPPSTSRFGDLKDAYLGIHQKSGKFTVQQHPDGTQKPHSMIHFSEQQSGHSTQRVRSRSTSPGLNMQALGLRGGRIVTEKLIGDDPSAPHKSIYTEDAVAIVPGTALAHGTVLQDFKAEVRQYVSIYNDKRSDIELREDMRKIVEERLRRTAVRAQYTSRTTSNGTINYAIISKESISKDGLSETQRSKQLTSKGTDYDDSGRGAPALFADDGDYDPVQTKLDTIQAQSKLLNKFGLDEDITAITSINDIVDVRNVTPDANSRASFLANQTLATYSTQTKGNAPNPIDNRPTTNNAGLGTPNGPTRKSNGPVSVVNEAANAAVNAANVSTINAAERAHNPLKKSFIGEGDIIGKIVELNQKLLASQKTLEDVNGKNVNENENQSYQNGEIANAKRPILQSDDGDRIERPDLRRFTTKTEPRERELRARELLEQNLYGSQSESLSDDYDDGAIDYNGQPESQAEYHDQNGGQESGDSADLRATEKRTVQCQGDLGLQCERGVPDFNMESQLTTTSSRTSQNAPFNYASAHASQQSPMALQQMSMPISPPTSTRHTTTRIAASGLAKQSISNKILQMAHDNLHHVIDETLTPKNLVGGVFGSFGSSSKNFTSSTNIAGSNITNSQTIQDSPPSPTVEKIMGVTKSEKLGRSRPMKDRARSRASLSTGSESTNSRSHSKEAKRKSVSPERKSVSLASQRESVSLNSRKTAQVGSEVPASRKTGNPASKITILHYQEDTSSDPNNTTLKSISNMVKNVKNTAENTALVKKNVGAKKPLKKKSLLSSTRVVELVANPSGVTDLSSTGEWDYTSGDSIDGSPQSRSTSLDRFEKPSWVTMPWWVTSKTKSIRNVDQAEPPLEDVNQAEAPLEDVNQVETQLEDVDRVEPPLEDVEDVELGEAQKSNEATIRKLESKEKEEGNDRREEREASSLIRSVAPRSHMPSQIVTPHTKMVTARCSQTVTPRCQMVSPRRSQLITPRSQMMQSPKTESKMFSVSDTINSASQSRTRDSLILSNTRFVVTRKTYSKNDSLIVSNAMPHETDSSIMLSKTVPNEGDPVLNHHGDLDIDDRNTFVADEMWNRFVAGRGAARGSSRGGELASFSEGEVASTSRGVVASTSGGTPAFSTGENLSSISIQQQSRRVEVEISTRQQFDEATDEIARIRDFDITKFNADRFDDETSKASRENSSSFRKTRSAFTKKKNGKSLRTDDASVVAVVSVPNAQEDPNPPQGPLYVEFPKQQAVSGPEDPICKMTFEFSGNPYKSVRDMPILPKIDDSYDCMAFQNFHMPAPADPETARIQFKRSLRYYRRSAQSYLDRAKNIDDAVESGHLERISGTRLAEASRCIGANILRGVEEKENSLTMME